MGNIENEKMTLNDIVEMLNEDELTELVRIISRRHLNCVSNALCEEIRALEAQLEASEEANGPYDIHDAWQDR